MTDTPDPNQPDEEPDDQDADDIEDEDTRRDDAEFAGMMSGQSPEPVPGLRRSTPTASATPASWMRSAMARRCGLSRSRR